MVGAKNEVMAGGLVRGRHRPLAVSSDGDLGRWRRRRRRPRIVVEEGLHDVVDEGRRSPVDDLVYTSTDA